MLGFSRIGVLLCAELKLSMLKVAELGKLHTLGTGRLCFFDPTSHVFLVRPRRHVVRILHDSI